MGYDVLTLGEALAVFVAEDALPLRRAERVHRVTAGAEVNVAVAASRLGLRACFVGRIGQDLAGEAVLDDLRREDLDVDHVVADPSAPTGVIVREASPSSARVNYLRSGSAGSRLGPEDLPLDAIGGARLVHVSGVTAALSSSSRAAARDALAHAHDCGVLTSFDLNYRSRLWSADEAIPVLRELSIGRDLLVGGVDEMNMTFGTSDPVVVREMTASRLVVVSHGGEPVIVADQSGVWQLDVPQVEVEDVVGAGDALVGGTAAGLLAGLTPERAVRQGVLCGSAVVQRLGDWTGLPWGQGGVLSSTGQEVIR